MSVTFYGTIQKIDALEGRLVVRCVREFFHGDGLMVDDVWIWEIESPERAKATLLQTMVGRSVSGFEINESKEDPTLRIWLDEGDESLSVAGKRIGKKEEARDECDLVDVISQLSKRIFRDEAEYLSLSRKLSSIATSVEQKIDRIRRRAEFQQQRGSEVSDAFSREIEDLQAILSRLKEPNQAPEPTAPSGLGSS